jgi:hypothetical protein
MQYADAIGRKFIHMKTYRQVVAGIVLTTALTGCGQKQDGQAVATAKSAKAAASQSQSSADTFVKAVIITVGESPVDLRFELPARPVPNQPTQVNLRLTGLVDSTALTVKTKGNDQIQVLEGADWTLDALSAGQMQVHGLSVTTKGTGVYMLEVAVDATRDSFTKTYTFDVPLAVLQAVPESSASSQ